MGPPWSRVAPVIQAAFQISGGISVANGLTINGSGINSAGAIENVGGTNTISSAINLASAASVGADDTTVLNIAGGFLGAQTLALNAIGTGQINFTGAIGTGPIPTSITKFGSGAIDPQRFEQRSWTGTLAVNAGSFTINGAGILGGTGAITVE